MPRHWIAAFLLLSVSFGSGAFAQSADPAAPPEDPKVQQFLELDRQLTDVFKQKNYDQAMDLCHQQLKLMPTSPEPHYNIACALARLGRKDKAIDELKQAVDLGFTDVGHIRDDDDLASLHDDAAFDGILKSARQKELSAPHEQGAEIPGVKSIEGFPEGGLRYRLRIDPAANKDKKSRLIIWLHPAGESMDDIVEAMSPQLIRDGFALLVFTQKDFSFWNDDQSHALLEHTLPEVATIDGVDAKKPVLMGFNSGGQMALTLWHENPGRYGGVILDSAYPIDPDLYSQGRIAPMSLPKTDQIQSCPLFVEIGGDDRGQVLWREVDQAWRQAKVPLTIHLVPDRDNEWLFTARQIAHLNDWLKDVAAGNLPADAAPLPAPGQQPDDDTPPARQVMNWR